MIGPWSSCRICYLHLDTRFKSIIVKCNTSHQFCVGGGSVWLHCVIMYMNHVVSTGDRGLKQEFNETFWNLKHLFYTVNITSFVVNKPKTFENCVPTHILTKSALWTQSVINQSGVKLYFKKTPSLNYYWLEQPQRQCCVCRDNGRLQNSPSDKFAGLYNKPVHPFKSRLFSCNGYLLSVDRQWQLPNK